METTDKSVFKIKKIGAGWQYTVYDIGNGRVRKQFNPWLLTFLIAVSQKWMNSEYTEIWKIPRYMRNIKSKAEKSFEIISSQRIPTEWMGNPQIIGSLDYEQDKVIPLYVILDTASIEEGKIIIDRFVKFCQDLMDISIIDKYFNMATNFGLTRNGKIIITDLGELVDTADVILQQRQKRIWAVNYNPQCISSKTELWHYYIQEMDKHFAIH